MRITSVEGEGEAHDIPLTMASKRIMKDHTSQFWDLPVEITDRILSSLSYMDVARASVVDKRLRFALSSSTAMILEEHRLRCSRVVLSGLEALLQCFEYCIRNRLNNNNSTPLDKFVFRVFRMFEEGVVQDDDGRIQEVLRFAFDNCVREVSFVFYHSLFRFKCETLVSTRNTLTTLKLGCFEVCLRDLLDLCPQLDDLSLICCKIIAKKQKELLVSSDKLRRLYLEEPLDIGMGIELSFKSLRELKISGYELNKWWIKHQILESPALEILTLSNCGDLDFIVLKSDSLKTVDVRSCFQLKYIMIRAPRLESFRCQRKFERCDEFHRGSTYCKFRFI